jgi:protein-S-isoprenylcysteine O-methyltransferase Ste14
MVWTDVGRERARFDASRLLDLAERAIFVIGLSISVYLNLRSPDPTNAAMIANNAITTLLLLFRRRAAAVSTSPFDWTMAVIGTAGGMLMRPGGVPLLATAPAVLIAASGFMLQLIAKLSLNRRFGIGPANRGIQDRWAYGLIRHPMYLGYLLIHTAYVLRNPTLLNVLVFTVTWACQLARILREERFLFSDPDYRSYAARVRFRLIPLLF